MPTRGKVPSPNTYSYVQEENLGSTRKFVQKLLIVYVYFEPNSCNTHADREWAQGTFLRQRRKVPPAHAQRVFSHHMVPHVCRKWGISILPSRS